MSSPLTHAAGLARRQPVVVLFTFTHIVVMTIVGIALDRTFLWIYLPLLALSIAAVVEIDRRAGPLSAASLWMLSGWALAHLAGGLLGDPSGRGEILYNWWLGFVRYDQLVHTFGIAVATLTIAEALRNRGRSQTILHGFLWAQLIGLGNEIVENVFALLVEESNVGDITNTSFDLVAHVAGGLIGVWWLTRGRRREADSVPGS